MNPSKCIGNYIRIATLLFISVKKCTSLNDILMNGSHAQENVSVVLIRFQSFDTNDHGNDNDV